MKELFMDIGNIVFLYGNAADSTAAKVASDTFDCLGVPLRGCSGVLFIAEMIDMAEGEACTFQIQYASDGIASNAATSNAGMTCTECALIFSTATTDIGGSNGGLGLGWFDVSAKGPGITDQQGVLTATRTASEKPGTLIAIPIRGTGRAPSSNSSDVVAWTADTTA